jgi:hypothetical protein
MRAVKEEMNEGERCVGGVTTVSIVIGSSSWKALNVEQFGRGSEKQCAMMIAGRLRILGMPDRQENVLDERRKKARQCFLMLETRYL